jgi:hypothetical protein
MGWLTDVGNIAVGAIERDREITKEDLAIRAENLQANRQILINQKQKKYDKELEEYYKEKEKFDNINKMNTMYKDGSIDKGAYASFALSSTIPKWNELPKDYKADLIDNFDGKTIDYKLQGSAEEINKKAAEAITMINNQTSKEIKDAKGNSFLINQILGRKEKAEKDIYKAIEAKLQAVDTVNMTEKSTENSGLEVKMAGSSDTDTRAWKKWKKTNKDWIKQYSSAVVKAEWNGSNQDKTLQGLITTGAFKNFDTKPFVIMEDGKVTGWSQQGDGFVNAYEQTYKTIHDSLDNKNSILKSYNYNDAIGGADINTGKINDEVNGIIAQRGSLNEIDGNSVFSMIPIGVIGVNNEMYIDGKGIQLSGDQLVEAMEIYDNFLIDQATAIVKQKNPGTFDIESDEDFIKAYNELQANMNRNRINGKETNLGYAFKKLLANELEMTELLVPSAKEGSNIEGTPLVEDDNSNKIIPSDEVKVDTKSNETKTIIKKEKPPIVNGSVISYTSGGKDREVDFSELNESDVEQLKIVEPEIYKKYITWKNNNTNKIVEANDTFSKNTNKFKNMTESIENEILSGNNKQAKK